jgi:hypothetical protein
VASVITQPFITIQKSAEGLLPLQSCQPTDAAGSPAADMLYSEKSQWGGIP